MAALYHLLRRNNPIAAGTSPGLQFLREHPLRVQKAAMSAMRTSVQTAAKVRCPPILLKNSLLRLQIFKKQKTVLRESKYSKKHR